jgi:hypothetical protein
MQIAYHSREIMHKMIRSLIATLFFVLCGVAPLAAQIAEQSVSANGSGLTQEEAVQSALVNAASQAFGFQLQAVTQVQGVSVDASVNGKDESVFLSAINKQVQQRLNTPGNNPILGYTVDQAFAAGQTGWEATVTLRYAKYEKLGAASDRRGVVVTTQDKRYRDLLLGNVEQSLVASRRFDVLNRDNQALFEQEKSFIESDDAAQVEVARLGQAAGADYLVIVQLQNFGLANNQRETIRMTGEVLVKSSVSGALKLEVVEFASRKVKWSGSEKFGATYKGASAISSGALGGLIGKAADTLVDRMVAAIYPMRIVKVMGNVAVLNRGEGSLEKGDRYDVFLMGDDLVDPQSGESLGALEIEVGKGTVTDVKPKFAFMKMDSGELQGDQNYVLRKSAPAPKAAPVKKAAPRKTNAGEPSRKNTFLN